MPLSASKCNDGSPFYKEFVDTTKSFVVVCRGAPYYLSVSEPRDVGIASYGRYAPLQCWSVYVENVFACPIDCGGSASSRRPWPTDSSKATCRSTPGDRPG